MEKRLRYHKYSKIYFFLKTVPLRILKFKRPKWKLLQNKITKNFFFQRKRKKKFKKKVFYWRKKKKLFLNYFKVKKVWKFFFDKYKKSHKNSLQLKNSWQIYTDNLFKNKKLKKKIVNTKVIRDFKIFLKLLFRLDLFLCKLKITKNRLEAKNYILNGYIIINGIKVLDERFYIKQGDTIFINPTLCRLKSSFIKRFEYPLEIDFYSNLIVISKNIELTSSLDFSFLKFEKVPYRRLYNFLKKN